MGQQKKLQNISTKAFVVGRFWLASELFWPSLVSFQYKLNARYIELTSSTASTFGTLRYTDVPCRQNRIRNYKIELYLSYKWHCVCCKFFLPAYGVLTPQIYRSLRSWASCGGFAHWMRFLSVHWMFMASTISYYLHWMDFLMFIEASICSSSFTALNAQGNQLIR